MRACRRVMWFAALPLALPLPAFSQEGRAGSWEGGFNIADVSSETLTGDRLNVSLDVGSELSYGGTASYYITDRLAFGGDIWFSSPNYTATRVLDDGLNTRQTVTASLDIWTIQFKGTFNFLEGAFTPYIEAGAGWTEIDSNIATGPPATSCWWDPWWGYTCHHYFETYKETRTSIMYGAGVRWEFGPSMVLRGSYNVQEVETNRASEDPSFDVVRLDLLWRF